MREYKIEARASVPYAMYIKANSNEEARKIAEKKAESYERTAMERAKNWRNDEMTNAAELFKNYDSWSMRVDDFALEIESVDPVCKIRPFIPNFDD